MAPVYTTRAEAGGIFAVNVAEPLAAGPYLRKVRQSPDDGATFSAWSEAMPFSIDPSSPVSGTPAILDLDFAAERYFRDGLWLPAADAFDFARLSDGIYRDAEGARQTAGSGVLRIDHDPVSGEPLGALIEGGRSNALVRSRDFDVSKIVQGGAISDDGNWQRFTEDTAAAALHRIFIPSGISTTSGQAYSLSALAKYVSRQWVNLVFTDGAATHFANFDLLNGVKGATSAGAVSIMLPDVDGGWLLCLTATATNTGTGNAQMGASDSNTSSPRYFDGTGAAFLADELQFEAGRGPTSRIRTEASAVTRAEDTLMISGDGVPFEGWDLAGMTFSIEAFTPPEGLAAGTGLYLCPGDGVAGPNLLYTYPGGPAFYGQDTGANVISWGSPADGLFKAAMAVGGGTARYLVNGGAVQTHAFDLAGIAYDRFSIGSRAAAGAANHVNSCVRRIRVFPGLLDDAELQALVA